MHDTMVQDSAGARRRVRAGRASRGPRAGERAVRPRKLLLGGALCTGRLGNRGRHARLPPDAQRARRRHQRRQIHLAQVRDGVQQRARRGVLRAYEEYGPNRGDSHSPAFNRHYLLAHRARFEGRGPGGVDRLRPGGCRRRTRVSVRISADNDLLEPGGGDGALPRRQGGRVRQAARQEDCPALPRLGLWQGADPGADRSGEEIRLRSEHHRRAASRQRAAIPVAAHPRDPARLGDPVGLGG
jgi:hypothetical protein